MSWYNDDSNEERKIYESLRRQNEERRNAENPVQNILNGIYENKEKILGTIAICTALFTGANKVVSAIDRHTQRKIESQRRRQVYDRSLGMYVDLKRPLSKSDYDKIEELKRKGFKTGEALKRLNLIK